MIKKYNWRDKTLTIKVSFVLTALWLVTTLLSFLFIGINNINPYWAVSLISRFGILAGIGWLARDFFLKENFKRFGALKKASGYGIVYVYVFYNLPRVAWERAGNITESHSFLFWILSTICMLVPLALFIFLSLKKTQVFFGYITKEEAADKKLLQENRKNKQKSLRTKVLENFDIIVQCILIVIVFQQFFIQIYQIPTESMVPTFLVKDRPLISRPHLGPRIPLTNWEIPPLRKVKRGDVVVFESPFYPENPLLKDLVHQFVFYLTFSLVNIDKYDEYGNEKASLVVKRVVGMPGEKLMMVDDQLYVKTPEDESFKPLTEDDNYKHVDLYKEDPEVRSKIEKIRVDAETRAILDKWDAKKNNVKIADLEIRLKSGLLALDQLINDIAPEEKELFNELLNESLQGNPDQIARELFEKMNDSEIPIYRNYNTMSYDLYLFYDMMGDDEHYELFKNFILSGTDLSKPTNLYEESSRKLNLIYKEWYLKRYMIYASLVNESTQDIFTYTQNNTVEDINRQLSEFTDVFLRFYDSRNFPEYPEKDNYIPENEYFLIGDNRYNSLDFRFSHDPLQSYKPVNMDSEDPLSMIYISSIDLSTLPDKNITALVVARIWPLSRIGLVK